MINMWFKVDSLETCRELEELLKTHYVVSCRLHPSQRISYDTHIGADEPADMIYILEKKT